MVAQDVRHAFRVHANHPLLAATVVATLALGIGANSAIFNLVNGILLRPLPYPESARIVRLYQTYERLRTSPNPRLQRAWNRLPISYFNALDYRRDSRAISAIGLFEEGSATLQGGGEPVEIEAAAVDAELFQVLGVRPALGRTFDAGEVKRRERLVVFGDELWRGFFGGDPEVLGRAVLLDGEPTTVIGVMPRRFQIAGGKRDRLWTPLALVDDDLRQRDDQRWSALARLAPGVSLTETREDLDRVATAQAAAFPDTNRGVGVRVAPLLDAVVDQSRPILTLLMAAVAVVLAVASVNVAHLLLSQVSSRQGELAIRRALGASRGRLALQLFAENLVLALAGGALGLLAAAKGKALLLAWIPADLPRTDEVAVDGRVLALTLGTSLAAALVCGLLPALSSSAAGSLEVLRGGSAQGGRGGLSAHNGFVVVEIALTLMLTAGAALLVHSFLRLSAVDPGFRTRGLLVQEVRLPAWRYADEHRRAEFSASLLARWSALPGVRSVAFTTKLPFAGLALVAGFQVPGLDSEGEDWTQGRSASMKFVTPGYFATLSIPVLEGRGFSGSDRPERGRVLVMNETLASRTWPGESAVGRSIVMSGETYTVVGVVADIRHDGVDAEPGVLMYQPWTQHTGAVMADALTAVLEVEGNPMDHAAAVRRTLFEIDPAVPVPAATTMERLLADSVGTPRSRTSLVLLLAGLALFLALVGTYAVMSFTVGRRVREIGIRMALGADASRVRTLVLKRTAWLTGWGIVLGILGALAGSRLFKGLLYGVTATDPPTLAAAATLLAAAALGAGLVPAVRASRVDPVQALRNE